MALKAKEHCCEEAVLGLPGYIPCNKPATQVVAWPSGETIRVCDMCAHYSITQRNAKKVGDYNG